MKNLTTLILATATLTSLAQTITPRGTGRTTGHIATISVHNPSDQPITAFVPPDGNINKITLNGTPMFQANENRGKYYFIPSHGKYQCYAATSAAPPTGTAAGNITIPPGDTLHISTIGYCADIHRPPVPDGGGMPPLSEWIGGDGNIPPPGSGIPDGFTPTSNPNKLPFIAANLPNQIPGKPLTTSIDKNPEAVEYIFHAIDQITNVFDSLFAEGAITTPFSGNDDKEREAVVQQTFWIYTSSLTGDPYTKPQFRDRMVAQYENKTGTNIKDAPVATVEKIDSGVDDFWNTFTTVGVEAKVISANPVFPHKDEMEKVFGKDDKKNVGAHTDGAADGASEAMGADAVAGGNTVYAGSGPDKATTAEEVAHVNKNNPERRTAPPSSLADSLKSQVFDEQEEKKLADRAVAGSLAGSNPGKDTKPPTPPIQNPAKPSEKPASCTCGSFKADISFPQLQPGRAPLTITANANAAQRAKAEINIWRGDIETLGPVRMQVNKIELICTCGNGPCPVVPIPQLAVGAPASSKPTALAPSQSAESSKATLTGAAAARAETSAEEASQELYALSLTTNPHMRLVPGQEGAKRTSGSAEWDFVNNPNHPGQLTTVLAIEAHCATDTCHQATCKATIDIQIQIR